MGNTEAVAEERVLAQLADTEGQPSASSGVYRECPSGFSV
ncbi:hypothetical protein MFUM_680002 [Methylacidiphilum fumariolicum SolV]|uniref:Uncharacterized protein n=1 Tax=Methylacidiphilum fumariolicum (strain SolV) TaxID=1156937 RepID=I0JYL6_METFB|nr:hypothetical protein MFUM_680002 [Methylacidiphilum fumariolicum SolV]